MPKKKMLFQWVYVIRKATGSKLFYGGLKFLTLQEPDTIRVIKKQRIEIII